jgi:hypothetical protein
MKLVIFILFLFIINFINAQSPVNWTRDEINPGEDFTLTADGSVFTEGLKSCHLQLNSGSVPYLKSDVFYITPGAEYEFSFDVFDNDTAGQVKVYADFYDIYGFDIFGEAPVFSVDSSEWQTKGWTGTVPMQAAVGYILVKFYNQPDLYNFTKTAHTWLDNFRFSEGGGDNLVVNGGFEEWFVGVDEPGSKNEILSIYPNPAKDFISILLPDGADLITISDMTGREVLKIDADRRELIRANISQLQEGLYFVRCLLRDNSVVALTLLID